MKTAVRFARRDHLAALGGLVLLTLLLLGALGPWLPLGDPDQIGAGPRFAAPSWAMPFGTDELGRDLLPRIVRGIRATFVLALASVCGTAILGTLIGLYAAYVGRWVDTVIARAMDIMFAFPALMLGLLVAAVIGPGSISALAVILFATLPLFVRVVRSVTLGMVGRGFVTAAEVAGASRLRVMLVHLLPNVLGAVLVQFTYAVSIGILIESGLSFLGLGSQPPESSLGALLRLGSVYLTIAPWLALSAGVVLALSIVAVNLLGDGLRDALEPLRGRRL
ncbi:peptide/nickel transport system permease protein [Variovorax boronicumulans]|uniref:ABC transporter permease n=1 Tax=Variovorax TaxID=34072 RepID=UPI00278B3EE9|nr:MULTISPECIES: ABC transporter permease [Variovorax]MDQ0038083.1 peptide/nickel transport system permease protein [Variovorax boronicumulans]